MNPQVQTFFDPATSTATYLVVDPATRAAAVIDPVLDYEPKSARLSTASADAILGAVREQGLDLKYVLETHAHADHLSAADHLRRETGAEIAIGALITQVQKTFAPLFEMEVDGSVFDRLLEEGDELPLGDLTIRVMHTPGHTAACVTYLVGNAAFVGDTVFMPDFGTARTDFPGGDAAALYRSIQKIFALPDETRVFTGHDYPPEGRTETACESSVAEQRAHNVHIRADVSEEDFVALRKARNAPLPPPVLILPALQVNIRGGALPEPTAGGRVYLKLPVNGLPIR